MPLPLEILNESQVLFRDVRPEDVDAEADAEFVIARVLDHGTVRSVPVTEERLHLTAKGQVRLELRQPWRDGTTRFWH